MKAGNLIFDVDGTLWDTTEIVARAWNAVVKERTGKRGTIAASVLKKEFGKTMEVIAEDLFGDMELKERTALMERCCELEQQYLEDWEGDLTYPGTRETIRTLAKCFGIYIVSNCHCGYIELFLQKNGLGDCVQDFECFGGTGLDKGKNICLLLERNSLKDAVYIGDTEGDQKASAYAGLPFLYAAYGFGEVTGAQGRAEDIRELPRLLEKIG